MSEKKKAADKHGKNGKEQSPVSLSAEQVEQSKA